MSQHEHITLPSKLEVPAVSFDLTILTVLTDGRHLWFTNIVREGDSVERMAAAHCAVRKFYHPNIAHFVVVAGSSVERLEVGRG
jgi:hypothetical protein